MHVRVWIMHIIFSTRESTELIIVLSQQFIMEFCREVCCICYPSADNFCFNITKQEPRLGGTIKHHSNSHMHHNEKHSGRTYLTPNLRGVKEHEVLSRPETAEHTDRRVQMLDLRLQELFPPPSPPWDFFSFTFIQLKRGWGLWCGNKYQKPKRCEKTEGETRRSPPVRPVWWAHRGEHPLQQSREPEERERRGGEAARAEQSRAERSRAEQNRHSLLLLLLTAWH